MSERETEVGQADAEDLDDMVGDLEPDASEQTQVDGGGLVVGTLHSNPTGIVGPQDNPE